MFIPPPEVLIVAPVAPRQDVEVTGKPHSGKHQEEPAQKDPPLRSVIMLKVQQKQKSANEAAKVANSKYEADRDIDR